MTKAYPRPSEPYLSVEREPVAGECSECGAKALQRYPVLAEGGWFDVVKCAECLHSASRTRGPRLGPISLLADLV
jgi:hypothetical protein